MKKLHKLCDNMSQFIDLQNITEINAFALSLKKWLQWMMKKTMSWKQTHNQFNFYWNNECNETIKKMKKLRQMFIDLQNKKKLKNLFSYKWLQTKNCTQNKNFEILKNN